MRNVSKIIYPLLIVILPTISFLIGFKYVNPVYAELEAPAGKVEDPDPFPQLKYPCDEKGEETEFHSLRPYQASPCGGAPLARFCSNELVFIETFDLAYEGDCQKKGVTRTFSCNPNFHVNQHDLYIELSGSELPILGNTEQVTNSQGGTEEYSDAQKVNEYASWYLSGVNSRAEYGTPTDEQIINYSGPLNKLIPSMIAEAERKKTIIKTVEEVEFTDDIGTSEDGSATDLKEIENQNQTVVCADEKILGIFGNVEAKPCPDGENFKLRDWTEDLSFLRTLSNAINNVPNTILNGALGGLISAALNAIGVDTTIDDSWNYRFPPLPWDNGKGEAFETDLEYKKAYAEWQGKTCVTVNEMLFCFDNPLVTNKYADLYHYIPLSATVDKKGANYIMGDGPSYTGGAGTKVENGQHTSYSGAPLYFAHTQEVKELSNLLNQTFQYDGFKDEGLGYPKDVEVIKKGSKPVQSPLPTTLSPDKQYPTYPGDPYAGMDCSSAKIRVNEGDNLFAGDKGGEYEMWVKGVEYDITEVECQEIHEMRPCPTTAFPNRMCPVNTLKCPAYVELSIKTAVKSPNVDQIFKQTVAGTGSTFRKIFPKIEEGAPVECIADIPTSTDVYYDPTKSQEPQGPSSDISFKVRQNPDDGANSQDQLTFPHIGSVYEYFLNGIQTALRPKGYGSPIANGNCNPVVEYQAGECKQWLFEKDKSGKYYYDKIIEAALSTKCEGKSLNPFWAIGIALNENGGLMSDDSEGKSKSHFGCNMSELQTIEDKISCMVNTLRNDCTAGKTDKQALIEYGYPSGYVLWPITVLNPGGSYPPALFGSGFDINQLKANLTNADWRASYESVVPTFCPNSPSLSQSE